MTVEIPFIQLRPESTMLHTLGNVVIPDTHTTADGETLELCGITCGEDNRVVLTYTNDPEG